MRLLILFLIVLPALVFAESSQQVPFHELNACAQHLARILALTGQPEKHILRSNYVLDGRSTYEAKGLPARSNWITATGKEIFRHYVGSKEILDSVLQTGKLRAGSRPYVSGDSKTMVIYVDLSGVYITTPEWTSAQVDGHSQHFVDFHLPAGTKVLDIMPGIMVIPGPAGKPAWMLKDYEKWKTDPESVPLYVRKSMEQMDRDGVGLPLMQKIEIVGHG